MADHLTREQRSSNMRAVRGTNTAPERRVRSVLHGAGFRFRLNRRDVPGKPDLFMPKYGLAVFVHGCFWHGHEGCKRSKLPQTNADFWAAKVTRNRHRDAEVQRELLSRGFASVTLWECELTEASEIVERVTRALKRSGLKNGKAANTAKS